MREHIRVQEIRVRVYVFTTTRSRFDFIFISIALESTFVFSISDVISPLNFAHARARLNENYFFQHAAPPARSLIMFAQGDMIYFSFFFFLCYIKIFII